MNFERESQSDSRDYEVIPNNQVMNIHNNQSYKHWLLWYVQKNELGGIINFHNNQSYELDYFNENQYVQDDKLGHESSLTPLELSFFYLI